MLLKKFTMTCVAATLAFAPATKVSADLADGLVGGVVGGVVGGLIVNEGVKSRERNRNATTRSSTGYNRTYAPARQRVYEDQVALNYFGFPAGVPDGRSGRNTRNAVAQYQVYMGYPASGYLNEWEHQYLVTSYQRAQTGGAATTQLISQNGQGTRGLLHAYRDEAAGTAAYGSTQQTTTATFADPGTEQVAPEQTETIAALPNLMGEQGNGPSLASHCNQVSLLTSSNGGFVTEASMTDPRFALNEQFCLARTYAIAAGEQLASGLQGVSNTDLEEQCRGFGPAMQSYVAALSLNPQEQVMRDVRGFILQSGMSPAQLSGTAKICLSVGYRTDNMDVALGSALLLTALGENVYAELMGHHLNEGFGTAKRSDLALAWYQTGFDAIENGAEPVFVPGNPGRTALIRKAAYQVDGSQGSQNITQQGAIQPVSSLPVFNVQE
jgi:peptidoglycan hydrolase-like protein with peptidoglycan-binding domain